MTHCYWVGLFDMVAQKTCKTLMVRQKMQLN
jgi:hypothetical protein